MKLTQSFSSATRAFAFWASLAVCFCSLPGGSSAQQLTQQDVYDAFYAALFDFVDDTSGGVGFLTVPVDINFTQISTFLSSSLYGYSDVGDSTAHIDALLAGVAPVFYNFLRSLAASNSVDLSNITTGLVHIANSGDAREQILMTIGQDFPTLAYNVGSMADVLAHMTFDQWTRLNVHDSDAYSKLDEISGKVSDISTNTTQALISLGEAIGTQTESFGVDMTAIINGIAAIHDAMVTERYMDQDPSETESDATSEAEGEYTEEQSEAEDTFTRIALPTGEDPVTNSISSYNVDESLLGLDAVDVDVEHNALITLVRNPTTRAGSSLPVPDIEIDLGRMAELDTGLSQFSTWIGWLANALFGLFLSVKGLGMWRIVRTASISAQTGEQPIVHLAFNPF